MTESIDTTVREEYRTAPLKFPLHILNEDGESLCGNLTEQQRRFIEREGLDILPTIEDKRKGEPWKYWLNDVCGNCRRSLLAQTDDEKIHAGWEIRQEAMGNA